jgi:hypothetical protein
VRALAGRGLVLAHARHVDCCITSGALLAGRKIPALRHKLYVQRQTKISDSKKDEGRDNTPCSHRKSTQRAGTGCLVRRVVRSMSLTWESKPKNRIVRVLPQALQKVVP